MDFRVIATGGMLLLLALAGCSKVEGVQQQQLPQDEVQTQRPMDTRRPAHHIVSYYKVLARPEEYDGKRIQVVGILSISDEDNVASLYPNMESFHYHVKVDSLSIEFTSQQWTRFASLNGKFVAIEGTFKRLSEADDYTAAGMVTQTTRLVDLSNYYR